MVEESIVNKSSGWIIILVMVCLVAGILIYLSPILVGDYTTQYEYTIKAEQVEDASMIDINDTVNMDELNDGQKDVLFKAFKKSDRFFGSSSTSVIFEENYSVFDEWRVVEVNGVFFIVSIQKEPTEKLEDSRWNNLLEKSGLVLLAIALLLIVGLILADVVGFNNI